MADIHDDEWTPADTRLSRDLVRAARQLGPIEVQYLVYNYYRMQEDRIRADHQLRRLSEVKEPHELIDWLSNQSYTLENQIRRALDEYTQYHPVGEWMRSIKGIGPVLSAGLLAHIDIDKAPTVGHIWRYAGIDPTSIWEKGEKRPWNAELKTLCWKTGESFVKVSGDPNAYYGQIYKGRKAYEISRNEKGELADQAARGLAKLKKADTVARKHYSSGRLPPAHIHARACRYTVKLFLSHLHEKLLLAAGRKPVVPYPIAYLGHVHHIPPPERQSQQP